MNIMNEIVAEELTSSQLKQILQDRYGLPLNSYYLLHNGKIVDSITILENEMIGSLKIVPRILGGKGGFGSMLRAIGAQIEKTTNREACRDLSGRRLRDINEEQRLKNWINQQAEREKEAKERKKKKLEKACQLPKHEFNDTEYDKERSALPEAVEDAVLQGLLASTSSVSTKRKSKQEVVKKKKPKLWVEDELDDDLSSSGSEKDESSNSTKEEEKEIKNNKTETLLEIPSVIPSTTEKKIEGHSLTIENKEKES
ncbi:unnamed protein product [Psylliodes chrysocephalus]|uniref:Ubiquitin-like domain-containing protein n=1 Tax=Psylliodes chrysocephalus TaxID=3402493 RepID=A0A9P0CJW6_9CUCU|nr:unnamed protein product [Psylliodes chrysocephala]